MQEYLSFGDHRITVHRKPYRRKMTLSLKVTGAIQVSVPRGMPPERIRDFVHLHGDWIKKNLAKYTQLRESFPQKQYVEGEVFPLMGRDLKLSYEFGRNKVTRVSTDGARLVILLSVKDGEGFDVNKPHPEMANVMAAYYAEVAKKYMSVRFDEWTRKMNLFAKKLTFRSQKTRWGSCNSRGTISLNWRLIAFPLHVIDYVIVHEIAHLEQQNHSVHFWRIVARFLPDFNEARDWLRANQYTTDFLAKRSELHD